MPLLEIQNLKKYFKNIKAVDDISFSVDKDAILGLLGPNGAGKSTAISMIATLKKRIDEMSEVIGMALVLFAVSMLIYNKKQRA